MKKKSLLKKVTALLCTFSFFIFQSAYSQCDNPVPTGDSAQVFCDIEQATIGDLVTNEITIAWFDAPSGGNQLIASTKLQDGNVYYADNNFNGGCSPTRLEITVTINGLPPQTFPVVGQCSNQNPTINDIPVIGTDIKWYDAEFGGTLLNGTDLLEHGKQYWAEQTVDGCTSLRSVTNVLLIAPPTPTTPTEQGFCSIPTPTVADLQANDTDPNSDIFWYDSETSTTSLSPSTLLISGRQYWASVTNSTGCESASRIVTTVSIDIAPDAGISGIYPDCEINSSVDLFDYLGGTPDETGVWTGPSDLSNGHRGTYDPFLNFEGVYTYTVKSDLGVCDDAVTTVTIELVVPPTPELIQVLCEIDNPTIGSIEVPGTNIKYYDTETSPTPLDPSNPLVDGDYWVTQTDVNGCESSPRVKIDATINAPAAPTTSNPSVIFCEIEDKTVADLNADITGTDIKWYDSETSTTPLSETTLLVAADYWATQTDTEGCESKLRLKITVGIDATLPPTTINQDQKFCLNDFAPLTPKVSDIDITGNDIKWYDSETSETPLNETDDLVNGDYWATQTDATTGCESKLRTLVNVELLDPLNATGEPNQSFCLAENPTIADIIVTGDTIIWYETENSTTPLVVSEALVDGKDYWALNTILGCESTTRLKVTVEIMDALPPDITEPTQSFCASKFPTIAELTPSENILWFASEIIDTPLATSELLVDGTTYWAATNDPDNGCVSSLREPVDVTLFLPIPPTGDENQVFCEIDDPTIADLVVTGTDIRWYDSETSTTPLESTEILIDGVSYWAAQITSIDDCESQRLMVTVTINMIPAPTTSNPTQTFCEVNNSTIADINVVGDNIKWYADETSITELSPTELLIDGSEYWASQTDPTTGCESKSRLKIDVIIISVPDATTTENVQTFCIGNNPTIANLTASGDLILWFDSETSTTILPYTTPLVDGQEYWALNTDTTTGCISPNRLMIDVVVQDIVNSLIVPVEQEFCTNVLPTVANLNPNVNATWYASETDPSPLDLTVLLVNDQTYWAAEIDVATGCISSVRLPSKVILDSGAPPTTTEPTQTFCEIDNATLADLSITGIGIIWYETETSTIPLDTSTVLMDGTQYWASQTDPCESTDRLMISVVINTTLPPTSSNETQVFCLTEYIPNSPTVADLTVTGNNIIWYESETATTSLDASEVLINNEDYWASQTDAITGCESKSRLKIISNIIDPAPASGQPDQSFCQADNPTLSNIVVTGDIIVWFDSETSTTPLDNSTALEDGLNYWALNTDATSGCESSSRFMVTIIIQDALPPATDPNQTFCASDLPTINDLQVEGIVNWYATETDTTPLDPNELLKNDSYWAATLDNTIGCISSVRVATLVTLIDPGTPILDPDGNKFCIITNPTIADLDSNVSPSNNGLITWYDSYPNGNPLSLSDFLIDGNTYYALETDFNSCVSMTPLEVTVDLNACEEYDIIIYDGFSPNGDGINDTFTVGNLEILYPNYKIEFFNRWGEEVFTTSNEHKTWNGRLHSDQEFVPSGVYYYIIHFNKNDRKPVQYSLYLSR